MTSLSATEIETIRHNIRIARDGLLNAKRQLELQREQFVRATIDATDLVVHVRNLNRSLDDPAYLGDHIVDLERALEGLEDLIFNPQDKAEILSAIRSRPNAADELVGQALQRAQDATQQIEAAAEQLVRYRNRIRRHALVFCAAAGAAALVLVWSAT